MANDVDIIVGVKDLATAVLDKLSNKVGSIGDSSKLAFAGAAERLNDQFAKASSNTGGAAGYDKLAKAIDSAALGLSTKLDSAIAKTYTAIDGVVGKLQSAINSVTGFVTKAAAIAGTAGAFITVYRAINSAANGLASLAIGYNGVEQSAQKAKQGILSGLAPFAKYIVAAGAATTLTKATLQATSATSSLATKAAAVTRGALAAFVLKEALKKTEDGASTLGAKLAKVAAATLALDVVTRATVRFGLGLVGLGKKADDSTVALSRTATAAKAISAGPLNAVKNGASAAAAATANLASKIDDLPKGAQSVNTIVASFGNFASQIGGIPGLLLSIPAGIAGIALAAVTATGKTERQLTQLSNKLAIIEAAKLNVSIEKIDTAPLQKVAEEAARVAKQIQTATNVQSSKLLSAATNALPKGLDTAQIGDALKAAVGLSEVYGTSVEDGMYRTRQAIEGNFEAFEKLIPSIKTMATSEEKLAAVSKLASNGFKIASTETLTFWGTIEKVKNGLGNTLEAVGRMRSGTDIFGTLLRDVVAPIVDVLDEKLKGFGFSGKQALEIVTASFAGMVAVGETLASNWSSVIDRMVTGVQLFGEQTMQSIYHAFSVVVNDYIPWLGRSIVNGFVQAAKIAGTVFQDMATKAIDSVSAVASFVSKGGGVGAAVQLTSELAKINLKPITGEFKLAFEALPDVAARAMTETEKILTERLNQIDGKLGNDFSKSFSKSFGAMQKMLKDQAIVGNIDLKAKAPAVAPDLAADVAKSKSTNENLQAFSARLLTRGSVQDTSKFIAQHTAQSVQTLKRLLAIQERAEKEANRQKGRVTNLVVVGDS